MYVGFAATIVIIVTIILIGFFTYLLIKAFKQD